MARAPLGLARTLRLGRPADFDAVRRGGLKTRDSLFLVTAACRDGSARIGVVVSRRVSTKAVTRNRIKRQIRESFRTHQAMLQGLDIVAIAQPDAAAADNATLAGSLGAHWRRLAPKCGNP